MGLKHLKWEELITKEKEMELMYLLKPSYVIGLKRRIEDEFQQGLQQGKEEAIKLSVKAMKELGIDEKIIAEKLNLSLKKVKEILNDKNK